MDRDGRGENLLGGEEVTDAMLRARLGSMGGWRYPSAGAFGDADHGRQNGVETEIAETADTARCRSRTGLAELEGTLGALADGRRQVGSGMARSRVRARLNWVVTITTEVPRPALWQMQGEAACRAGEPSGQGEDPSSEGLGGHDLLTQADAGRPARRPGYAPSPEPEPGAVGGKTAGRHVVQPDADLRSRMAFSTSAWRR